MIQKKKIQKKEERDKIGKDACKNGNRRKSKINTKNEGKIKRRRK